MKKICLLYGGESTERSVSLSSYPKIRDTLNELGYEVSCVDPKDGIIQLISELNEFKPNCVFNGLYGGYGESGEIQSILNLLRIPYTHSGVTASRLALDKSVSDIIFREHRIPTPKTAVVAPDDIRNISNFQYPYVIKPVSGGSSVGVYIITCETDLEKISWEFSDNAIAQEYIPGRELTVGILNGKALAVTEITPKTGFYNYETKYSNGMAEHILPAKISKNDMQSIMRYAESAYNAFGCRGIARADFRYNDQTSEIYILEVNTQPGMTELSLFPEQAKYLGISFSDLIKIMVDQACYDI